MFHLPFPDQIPDCPRHIFDGHIWIDPMLIEKVDVIRSESFQRRFRYGTDIFRPAVQSLVYPATGKPELCRYDDLIPKWLQGLPENFLIYKWSISFGGVEKSHAQLIRFTDQSDGVFLFSSGAETEAEAHAAKTQRGNFQTALS